MHPFRSLVTLAMAVPLASQIAVQAVAPDRNHTGVRTTATIRITFAEPLQPGSVTPRSVRVFGRWSGVAAGTLALADGDRTVQFTPAQPFFPGETVTVMLSRAVTALSGRQLLGGHTWSFWIQPARGTRTFRLAGAIAVRRTGEGAIRTYGAYAGDLDHDGAPDLSLPNEDADDVRVLRNDGCGGYAPPTVHALPANYQPSTNEGQDLDGDGATDLAVGNIAAGQVSVLRGDGNGGYLPAVQYPSGAGCRGLCVLDADGDGDVDVVTANRAASNLTFLRNRGDGTFDPAVAFDGGGDAETAIGAGDANGDGIADLFVGCYGSRTVTLLLGRGDGTFTLNSVTGVTGQPWMIAVGDVDRDGAVDAVVCTSTQPRVAVVRGSGAGGLLPGIEYTVGSFPIAVDLGDLDGDGALDFAAANFTGTTFTVYWNDGAGGFGAPLTLSAPQAGSCTVLVDDDRDGDLDLLGIDELADVVLPFRQLDVWPRSVQLAGCTATLRVDAFARGAGFGIAPPHPVAAGTTLFTSISGGAQRVFGVLAGIALEPGVLVPFGTFNLTPGVLVALPGGVTDAFGEAVLRLPIPAATPLDAMLALQGGVADPGQPAGVRLTNPEVVIVR